MERVESLIKQNLNNNNTAVNKLQGKIGILKSDLSKHHEKLVKLDNIIMDFHVKIHNLGLDGRLVKNELDKLKVEQYLQAVASYALTVHNDIQTIITALLFAKRNTIHPKIISPKTILSELILSTKHLPNHLHYPYTLLEQNTEGIMDLSNIKVFRVNQLLIFIISNPLTVDEVFDLYKMIPFPSKLQDNQFVYVKPKDNFLVINEYRVSFTFLSNINKCKPVHPELYVCQIDKPLINRLKNKVCEVELLVETKSLPKNCDLRIIDLTTEIWEKIHYFNTWIYVVPKPTELKITCPETIKEIPLENTGVVTLNSECHAFTPSIQLFPNQVEFHEEFHSIIPKANLSSIMAPFKSKLAKFVSKNLEVPIISVQNFEDLNKAGTSIQSVLNNDEILISNFNILLILIIITTITIVMLVVSVYKKYRKIKDIKAEATQQELLPMGSNKTNATNVTPFEINETAV